LFLLFLYFRSSAALKLNRGATHIMHIAIKLPLLAASSCHGATSALPACRQVCMYYRLSRLVFSSLSLSLSLFPSFPLSLSYTHSLFPTLSLSLTLSLTLPHCIIVSTP